MHTLMRSYIIALGFITSLFFNAEAQAAKLFIPMDADGQANHIKAYGVAYAALKGGIQIDWLLNYKGGSFAMDQVDAIERMCKLRGVTYEVISDAQYTGVLESVLDPDFNGDIIKLEKPPRVAVYTPPNKEPWDDAVTMALTYAEIPFDKVYDDQVLDDGLSKYDWLHLHHEDFTGQYGKFWYSFHTQPWYQHDQKSAEATAAKHGFKKVSQLKLGIAKKIRDFVAGGGYMFAMCSATDSYDIALAAEGVDICEVPFDGDGMDPAAQQKLDFTKSLAFKDFTLVTNPAQYEYSNIDNTETRNVPMNIDYFTLFTFSAKFDPVPAMLCQNHTTTVKGFMGQTTAFRKSMLKSGVLVMGEFKPANEARYIHGEYGKGTWTFYGGHDPEDYQHNIGDPPTELSLHPNSPGYRLILNNVLFPAAKKKPRKT
ncbi:MAG: asparagine synthetase B [Bacteroidota bacterium]